MHAISLIVRSKKKYTQGQGRRKRRKERVATVDVPELRLTPLSQIE